MLNKTSIVVKTIGLDSRRLRWRTRVGNHQTS